ncbi:MAG: hypothetical protein K0S37_2064 [Microbacterium sp.]|jgi:hypothetical protein|nr:hypothetical protein [Microbacterium sp.]
MTAHEVRTRAGTEELAWTLGGSLLIGATVLPPIYQPPSYWMVGTSVVWSVMLAASLLVFAFGIRGHGSVTARRPLGTIALTALAALTVLMAVLELTPVLSGAHPSKDFIAIATTVTQVDLFLRFGLALVATVQIARAGIVPAPWNWAPLVCLCAVGAAWLGETVIWASAATAPTGAVWTLPLAGMTSSLAAIFLGVLAIALANRRAGARAAAEAGATAP